MTKEKTPIPNDHFEKLKALLPNVYAGHFEEGKETESQKLFRMLKHSLGVIEAVYLQSKDSFTPVRVGEYGKIIEELKELGYAYNGHPGLLHEVADRMIMQAKKPMEKAKGKQAGKPQDRKAG